MRRLTGSSRSRGGGARRLASLVGPVGLAALAALASGVSPLACRRGPGSSGLRDARIDASAGAGDATQGGGVIEQIERAEDGRRAKDVPASGQASHDPAVRRAAARAFARILDADDGPLLRALEDDDDEVLAWGAYGLGESCHGHEDTHVRALAGRLASVDPLRPVAAPVDGRVAALRALGRCGGDAAEQTLRGWLRRLGSAAETLEAAAFALGDASARRGSISLESAGALLDAAAGTSPVDAALFAFGRIESGAGDDLAPRLLAVAEAALSRAGPMRSFAVKALGRAGPDAAGELGKVLASSDFTPAERAVAAQGLARLHSAGQAALASALAALAPAGAALLAGDDFGVLRAAVDAVAADPPHDALAPLWTFAGLSVPSGAALPVTRRASQVRCAAAARLARGGWDSEVVRGCDVADGQAGERARLTALDRGELTRSRRAAWLELTRSQHLQVAEEAIEAIGRHPELGDAALTVLAGALASPAAGLVGTAADVVHAHPDRMFVLAASERRAALDPRAPPPTATPARDLDGGIDRALRAAMARPWSDDLVETRASILDAALAVGLDAGRAFALAACRDANATTRARAAKALAAAGEKAASCPAPDVPGATAPEIEAPLARATRIVFDTDAGSLGVRVDPGLAPVAATRLAALARAGFYTGVVVHRVVPGFVAQLGDHGGDGYGGAGSSLRCETSPVGFSALDVGVALAGRDTGSSQIFVALSRQPHLDGEYAWVGRADGDWSAVAEGDVVNAVRVEP